LLAFLLKRSLDSINKKLDYSCEAMGLMKPELVGYSELAKHLKSDAKALKKENGL
jgi:hypothetical protein